MEVTEKLIRDVKAALNKDGIAYEKDADYREATQNLVNFAELAFELAMEQASWDKRLETEPKGFTMEGGGRCCSLCSTCVSGDIWYTKWGLMCANCHRAYERKIIPGYVFKDSKNKRHITDSSLAHQSGLPPQTIRKLIRNGKIKAHQIPNGPWVILKQDNPKIQTLLQQELASYHERHSNHD